MAELLGLIAWALMVAGVTLLYGVPVEQFSLQGFAGSACLILALHAASASGRREERDQ